MDKPSNERGSTGPTDGIKAEGDAGNERHICKANPAMIDDIGKKHGLEDTSENFSGKKYALAPKAATKFLAMVAGITAAFTSTYFVGGMGRQWR